MQAAYAAICVQCGEVMGHGAAVRITIADAFAVMDGGEVDVPRVPAAVTTTIGDAVVAHYERTHHKHYTTGVGLLAPGARHPCLN